MRNEIIKANDCGDEAANWFSRYLLDSPNGLRLAYNLAEVPRNLTGAYPKHAELFPKLDNESGVNNSNNTNFNSKKIFDFSRVYFLIYLLIC